MRHAFFIFLLAVVFVSGCRRAEVQDYDGLRGELMQEAFALLAAGESARAVTVLERLADLSPEDRFFSLALIREQERQAMEDMNASFAAGDLDSAKGLLTDDAGLGGASEALVQAGLLHRELTGLREYLMELPFPDSDVGQRALERLRSRQTLLQTSSRFQAWQRDQEKTLADLREAERRTEADQLFLTLDLAVARDDPAAWLLLAELRALAPEDRRVRALGRLLDREYRELAELLKGGRLDQEAAAGLELGTCMAWAVLPERLRRALSAALRAVPATTLSGLMARALLSAEEGSVALALASLKELAPAAEPGPERTRQLLRSAVLPETQFQAGCWRSPCPSVADMLQRIQQLRTQSPGAGGGTR